MRSASPAVLLCASLFGLNGCSHDDPPIKQPTSSIAAPPASAKSSATAAGSASSAAPSGPILAWTDPAAIEGLTKSCSFAPPPAPDSDSPDALSCALPMEQSCVYDPCFNKTQDCQGKCVDTCTSCGTACASSCDGCKSKCTDDACRRACATTCGSCRQDCLGARDKCSTAGCAAVGGDACYAAEKKAWKANGCTGICAKYNACAEKCTHNADDSTWDACRTKCGTSLGKKCDFSYCPLYNPPEDK